MIEQALYIPLVFALCAVAWNRITEPGEVFGWLPNYLFARSYHASPHRWHRYAIARVTWACSKCIAGFWCLWFTIFDCIGHSNFDWFKLPAPLLAVAGALILERYLQDR